MLQYALNLDLVTLPLEYRLARAPVPGSGVQRGRAYRRGRPGRELAAAGSGGHPRSPRWLATSAIGAGTPPWAPGKALSPPAPHRLYLTLAGAAAPPYPRREYRPGPLLLRGMLGSGGLGAPRRLAGAAGTPGHLTSYPTQVSAATYARAVWARELVKGPELILAVIAGEMATTAGAAMLVNILREYLARYGAAALLLGESLEPFYPLGHRLFRLESGQLRQRTSLEHRVRPLTAYLPLV